MGYNLTPLAHTFFSKAGPHAPLAIQAARLTSMEGESPARGVDLFRPLNTIDNAILLIRNGRIDEIGSRKNIRLPIGCKVLDYGDCHIIPPLVNAHTHLQLSWLAGRTLWRKGFVPWLKSMVPLLLHEGHKEMVPQAAREACENLKARSIKFVGDVGGTIPGLLSFILKNSDDIGLHVQYFCEWFGFGSLKDQSPWPDRCRNEISEQPQLPIRCSPAGHALYSTSADNMRLAHAWCVKNKRIFSFHLAESDEESEMLLDGSGELREFYTGSVLPDDWKPPKMTPYALGEKLGLMGKGTLAVHGVKLSSSEIARLGKSGCALCLCPRSNFNLGVGLPAVNKLIESGALLCLGTDGLTSNTDVDVMREAIFLQQKMDIPMQALVRMLTINGYAALGQLNTDNALAKGAPADFCVIANGDSGPLYKI